MTMKKKYLLHLAREGTKERHSNEMAHVTRRAFILPFLRLWNLAIDILKDFY